MRRRHSRDRSLYHRLVIVLLAGLLGSIGRADFPGAVPDPGFLMGSGPDFYVRTLVLDSAGRVLISGGFTNVNNVPRPYFARVNADGTVDAPFAPRLDSAPGRIDLLADGRMLISGSFSNVNDVARPGLARLQVDGTLDGAFAPPVFRGQIGQLTGMPAPDGSVFVSGSFTNVGGQSANHLVRLG